MYSPKICEDLIPDLYKLGKALRKPMTTVVNDILVDYLKGVRVKEMVKKVPFLATQERVVYEVIERR